MTDHLGWDKGCFSTTKYRTYFACQYQRHRWHYPQAQDHLCRLFDPAVHLALRGPVDQPPLGDPAVHFALGSFWTSLPSRTLFPSGTNRTLWSCGAISPLGPGGPTVSLVVWLVSPIRLLIYAIIYLHRNFSSLIFGACHSKRKNTFYGWRDLTWYDQHLSRPQSACFLMEEI